MKLDTVERAIKKQTQEQKKEKKKTGVGKLGWFKDINRNIPTM